jgi:calcineurin-like phosphoesterase family protein/2'-5' RNA ligase
MLIEVRIGPGKRKLASSILKVKQECRLPSDKVHRVPHITLYGGFTATQSQVQEVKAVIGRIGRKYSFLPYLVDGFEPREGEKGKVIAFNIVPSQEFKSLRNELAENLLNVVPATKSFDKDEDFWFHATLAYKLSKAEFNRIWSYVSGDKPILKRIISLFTGSENYTMRYFYLPMNALRVTFLNDQQRIICEYDCLQKRLLSRQEALGRDEWQKTLRLFRAAKGIENSSEDKKAVYLISDLHLDHRNIIGYCARPFSDVKEMNDILVNNWNNIIRGNPAYFLGDLSGPRSTEFWLRKLKGEIFFIRGDHDAIIKNSKEFQVLEFDNHKFLLLHNPDDAPAGWDGWIIHGHKHNNDVKNYPFINGEKRTINVSAELINYKPVSLDYIVSLGLDSIKRMDTIDSKPERK